MVVNLDTWSNVLTGLGTARDKVTHTDFSVNARLSDQTLEALYHNDDIAARVCDLVPDEMLRQGFGLDDDALKAECERLDVTAKFNEALVWSRLFGGAAIFVGIDDGQGPAHSLNLEKAKAIHFLTVLDRRQLEIIRSYQDPLHPKYGEPELFRVSEQIIHESRLILFYGTRATKSARDRSNGWPPSVLQRLYTVMQQFNLTWQAATHLMSDAGQAVFKLKGLHSQIASNKTGEVLKRMELVDMSRSVARAIFLDAEDEDYRRDSYSFGGVPEILDKFMLRLAAAAKIPVSLLMGQAPAGMNSTGAADIRFFYDQVKSQQENLLKPKLLELLSMVQAVLKSKSPINITFPSLWQPTELEKLQSAKLQAEIDCMYVREGIKLPEEVGVIG